MCILCLSINSHPDFLFVCIHNRDENLKRPSLPPTNGLNEDNIWLDDKYHPIIGGKDLVRNGTWFGFNRELGHFSAINNFRSCLYYPLNVKNIGSRGLLVLDYLIDPPQFNEPVNYLGKDYPGFGIIHGNLFDPKPKIRYMTNRPKIFNINTNNKGWTTELEDGVHCYSNGYFNDETWPKVKYLKNQMETIVSDAKYDSDNEEGSVFDLVSKLAVPLTSTQEFKGDDLDKLSEDLSWSSLSPEKELANQRVFIEHNSGKSKPPLKYSGTCSQSIIVKTKNSVYFYYRSMYDYPQVGEWMSYNITQKN